jgi:hypothetical protein
MTGHLTCLTGLALSAALLAGCTAGPPTPTPDDPLFAGLDRATVVEALASPTVKEAVEGEDRAMMEAHLQNGVRNIYACRSALAVYQEWVRTGTAPAFPDQPTPTHPAMWSEDEDADIANFRKLAKGGEIASLRSELLDEGGCGNWVPAKPGDLSGPTVGDIVRGLK